MVAARREYPSVRRIVLQPAAGKPGCSGYATEDLDAILAAGGLMEDEVVKPGVRIQALDCGDLDNLDRLSGPSRSFFASTFAETYAN